MASVFRLVEHQPAWEVHAFLRFYRIAYVAEYSPSPVALGRTLPVIVTPTAVYSGDQIFDCPEITSAVSEDEKSINDLAASGIYCSLVQLFSHVLKRRNEHITIERQHGAAFFGGLFANSLEFSETIALTSADCYPDDSEADLMAKLEKKYGELSFSLDFSREEGAPICTCWSNLRKVSSKFSHHGKADALLFGHLARAFAHPSTAPLLQKLPNIRKYFKALCAKFFGANHHPTVKHVWEYSALRLVESRFTNSEGFAEVKDWIVQERDLRAFLDMDECRGTIAGLVQSSLRDEQAMEVPWAEVFVLEESPTRRVLSAVFLSSVGLSFLGYLWALRK